MEFKDLAPWIAIAFTLALSILVPLFTQIANNNHQRKMQCEKIEYEKSQEKRKAYEQFLLDIGGVVTAANYSKSEDFLQAGASLHKLYIYAPSMWWNDLDSLSKHIKKFEWDEAKLIMQKLSRLISEELNKKETCKSRNVKKN